MKERCSKLSSFFAYLTLFLFTLIFNASWAVAGSQNLASMIDDDDLALQARYNLIASATNEVLVAYHAIYDDPTTREFLSMLWKKAKDGAKVKIIVDGLFNKIPYAYTNHLIEAGVEIKVFNKRNLLRLGRMIRYRLHDKLLIADGENLIIGSRNLSESYFGRGKRNYKDRDVVIRGSSALDAQVYYNNLWEADHLTSVKYKSHDKKCEIHKKSEHRGGLHRYKQCVDRLESKAYSSLNEIKKNIAHFYDEHQESIDLGDDLVHNLLSSEPMHSFQEISRAELIHDEISRTKKRFGVVSSRIHEIIRSAENRVLIETPYLILTPEFEELLRDLKEKNVKVTILTNSLKTTDEILPQAAYLNDKLTFLRLGVELYEFFGERILHAKSIVVDDRVAVIGTYNFDPRSQNLNTETTLAIFDSMTAKDLERRIAKNMEMAVKIRENGSLEGHRDRLPETSFSKKIMTRILQGLFAPFTKDLL